MFAAQRLSKPCTVRSQFGPYPKIGLCFPKFLKPRRPGLSPAPPTPSSKSQHPNLLNRKNAQPVWLALTRMKTTLERVWLQDPERRASAGFEAKWAQEQALGGSDATLNPKP